MLFLRLSKQKPCPVPVCWVLDNPANDARGGVLVPPPPVGHTAASSLRERQEQSASFSGCGKKPFPDGDAGAQALAPRGRRCSGRACRAGREARGLGRWGALPTQKAPGELRHPASFQSRRVLALAGPAEPWLGQGPKPWPRVGGSDGARHSAADNLLLLRFAIILRMLAKTHFVPI